MITILLKVITLFITLSLRDVIGGKEEHLIGQVGQISLCTEILGRNGSSNECRG